MGNLCHVFLQDFGINLKVHFPSKVAVNPKDHILFKYKALMDMTRLQ